MKKSICFIMVILSLVILASCNNSQETDKEVVPEYNPAETVVETKPSDINIGNYTLTYSGEIKYNPYSDEKSKPTIIVYFNFKNNSDVSVIPSKVLKATATQDKKSLKTYEYKDEYASVEQKNLYKECKPKETITCCYCFEYSEKGGNINYEINDIKNSSKNKLSGIVDIKNIVYVTQNLCTDTAIKTEN